METLGLNNLLRCPAIQGRYHDRSCGLISKVSPIHFLKEGLKRAGFHCSCMYCTHVDNRLSSAHEHTNSLGLKVESDHIWSMGKLRLLSAWQQNDINSHEPSVALPDVFIIFSQKGPTVWLSKACVEIPSLYSSLVQFV